MTGQLDLFSKVEVKEPEPTTSVKLGTRVAEVNLRKKRRESLEKLMELLTELEDEDIYISHCGGNRTHFWMRHLKLGRMQFEVFKSGDNLPSVIVLHGNREASVRIFTEQVTSLRQQDYFGYTMWLLDFWNGFGAYPINPYRQPGYDSLSIVRFTE